MTRNFTLEKLGFKFIRNKRSKEIHRLKHSAGNCQLSLIAPQNGKYCTKLYALFLMKFKKHNGCVHCYKSKDNG